MKLKLFILIGGLVCAVVVYFIAADFSYQIIPVEENAVQDNSTQLLGDDSLLEGVVDENPVVQDSVVVSEQIPVLETKKTETKMVVSPIGRTESADTIATVMLADGCFWSVEHDLEKVNGVISVVSGYAGGTIQNPTYSNYVAAGHREVVMVTYNPQVVSYANLVEHIIKHGNPTDAGGSFYDRGPEYVPAIYFENDIEKNEAKQIIAAVDTLGVFDSPLPLLVLPTTNFYPAEEYHQDFAKKNPARYGTYRVATGRDAFIKKHWGSSVDTFTVTANF